MYENVQKKWISIENLIMGALEELAILVWREAVKVESADVPKL